MIQDVERTEFPAQAPHAACLAWAHAFAEEVDPLALLAIAEGHPRFFWQTPSGEVVAGVGVARRVRMSQKTNFAAVREGVRRMLSDVRSVGDRHAPQPVAVGGFAFDEREDERWAAFGSAHFVVPRVLLHRRREGAWLTVIAAEAAEAARLWRRVHRRLRRANFELGSAPCRAHASDAHPEREIWLAHVARAVEAVRAGTLRKVVLARTVRYPGCRPDPVAALAHLRQRYVGSYCFLFEPRAGHAFFGASPETLAEVENGALRTMALAGSARRGATPEDDAAQAESLLRSVKDRHEHALVAEAIVQAVQPLSVSVHVEPTPHVLRLPNIQHLHTPITAHLRPTVDVWDVLAQLHPTPAVGGLPRRAALALMQQLEPFARGWYAAPFGVANAAGEGHFAVAIRSALATPEGVTLFAGAGIVADSEPQREWEETALKLRPLLEAITQP